MSKGRDVEDSLDDILAMADAVQEFLGDLAFEQFLTDRKTIFAVFHALEVMGEASKNVPSEVRNRHPHIPWKKMAGMRDNLIHGYFGVDAEVVWETATRLVPELRSLIESAVSEERGRRPDG